jgi:hypothetical protein
MNPKNDEPRQRTDRPPATTAETVQLLAARSGIELKPEEIEPLCHIYLKLEQMKALIRKPRDYGRQFAHTFQVRRNLEP